MKRILFFFIALSLFASTAWGGTSWWNSPVGQMFSYGGTTLLLDCPGTSSLVCTSGDIEIFIRASGDVYLNATDNKYDYEVTSDVRVYTQWGWQAQSNATNKLEVYSRLGADLLGSELWDSAASTFESGTYSWVAYGTNTVANVSNSLEVTYVDNSNGVYIYLANSSDLSSDLVVGAKYELTADFKVNSGSSVTPRVTGPSLSVNGAPIVSTSFVEQTISFVATNTTGCYFSFPTTMGVGEIVYIDNISLKEVGGTKISDGSLVKGLYTGAQNTAASNKAIPGMTVSGDAAGVLSVVDATTEVDASNYARILPSKKMYELSCAGASVDCTVCFDGALSAADHALSIVAFGATSSDTLELSTDNVGGTPQTVTTGLVRYGETITALAADLMCISTAPNDVITFALVQAELGTVPTSHKICEGAACSGAITKNVIPQDGNYSPNKGTILDKWTTSVASADAADGSYGIATLQNNNAESLLYWYKSGATVELRMTDGTNTASVALTPVAGTTYYVGGWWDSGTSTMGVCVDGTCGSNATYDGDFTLTGTDIEIGYAPLATSHYKETKIYNVNKGSTWVDAETTP